MILDLAHAQPFKGIVRTEGIAGKQNPVFLRQRVHRIRPMQIRRHDQLQRLSAQVQRHAFFRNQRTEILIYDFL